MEKIILNGKIDMINTGDDNYESIGIIPSPLTIIAFDGVVEEGYSRGIIPCKDFEIYNKVANVRFYIGDSPISDPDKLDRDRIEYILGKAETDYNHIYSDLTGYLWTDEEFKVGGHDLNEMLYANEGKYIHMEIELYDRKELPDHLKNKMKGIK